MRFLKQSHSAEKLERGTLWAFRNFSLLQNIKKLEGGPFGDKKIRKKSCTVPKKLKKSHSAKRNCLKKFLAKARTRTRDRWVHRKPSTDEYM